jgi:hypothetical protein
VASCTFGDAPDGAALEIEMAEGSCDIGLIGLAVMGQNLVLNMNDHGYKVAVFNRTTSKVDEFLADEAKGTQVVAWSVFQDGSVEAVLAETIPEQRFDQSTTSPRLIPSPRYRSAFWP